MFVLFATSRARQLWYRLTILCDRGVTEPTNSCKDYDLQLDENVAVVIMEQWLAQPFTCNSGDVFQARALTQGVILKIK